MHRQPLLDIPAFLVRAPTGKRRHHDPAPARSAKPKARLRYDVPQAMQRDPRHPGWGLVAEREHRRRLRMQKRINDLRAGQGLPPAYKGE